MTLSTIDEKEYKVANVILHPKFSIDAHGNYLFNIAVMSVNKPFDTSIIKPIELYNPSNPFFENMFTIVAGVNIKEALHPKMIFVMTVDEELCKRNLQSRNIQQDGLICTGSFKFDHKNICPGKESSILIIDQYLAGIAAFPTCNLNSSIPGVYTEISHFYDWISDHIK